MIVSDYPIARDITGTLSEFVSKIDASLLPSGTRDNLMLFFLDYVAAVHAGYRVGGSANEVLRSVELEGGSSGKAHVFFAESPAPPLSAAFVNAFCAHGADMDDGNRLAAGHIGAHVISALMALAESRGSCFSEFYSAMAAGYEAFCRLSAACMPYMVDRGFHSTGTVGALASAAACARLLGLGSENVANAISLSATQSSGLLLAGETRQDMKGLNPANAARVGILSALLAERGVRGPLNPLESSKGWLHAMTPRVDLDRLLGGLGERFCIDESYLKPYPSCRHTHSAIEAAIAIGREVPLEAVGSVEIVTYGHAIDLAGLIELPSTVGEAKFSIKYAVAVALKRGRFALEDLSPDRIDDGIRWLVARERLERDDEYEHPECGVRGARVTVVTIDGDAVSKEVLAPKGEPENPFSLQDVRDKLRSCFSDADGNPDPAGAEEFLDWYVPMMSDPDREFVFPQKGAVR